MKELIIFSSVSVMATKGQEFRQQAHQQQPNQHFDPGLRAATFDVQDPLDPLLVGGAPSLPGGPDAAETLRRYVERAKLVGKELLSGLSEAEQERLEALSDADLALAIDSVRVRPVIEWEEGVQRKRLYVANGSGGVARLNLDEQNGLQLISEARFESESDHVGDVLKWGAPAFASRALDVPPPDKIPVVPCGKAASKDMAGGVVERLSYLAPFDPVYMGRLPDMRGGNVVIADGAWLYSGGQRGGWGWNTSAACSLFRFLTANKPKDAEQDTVTAVNLFDPVLTRQYSFAGNVLDLVSYGDYLVAALGSYLDARAQQGQWAVPASRWSTRSARSTGPR